MIMAAAYWKINGVLKFMCKIPEALCIGGSFE